MLLKQQFFPLGVSATWNHKEHREQRETPGGQTNWCLNALYIKKIQNIIKYLLYKNASKINR